MAIMWLFCMPVGVLCLLCYQFYSSSKRGDMNFEVRLLPETVKLNVLGHILVSHFARAADTCIFRLLHIHIYIHTDAHMLCLEKPWVFMDCILQKSRRCQIEEGRRKFCRSPCDSYYTQDHFGKLQFCAQLSTTVTVFSGVLCHALIHHIIRRWPERF